jgi:hypothetical protein
VRVGIEKYAHNLSSSLFIGENYPRFLIPRGLNGLDRIFLIKNRDGNGCPLPAYPVGKIPLVVWEWDEELPLYIRGVFFYKWNILLPQRYQLHLGCNNEMS